MEKLIGREVEKKLLQNAMDPGSPELSYTILIKNLKHLPGRRWQKASQLS